MPGARVLNETMTGGMETTISKEPGDVARLQASLLLRYRKLSGVP